MRGVSMQNIAVTKTENRLLETPRLVTFAGGWLLYKQLILFSGVIRSASFTHSSIYIILQKKEFLSAPILYNQIVCLRDRNRRETVFYIKKTITYSMGIETKIMIRKILRSRDDSRVQSGAEIVRVVITPAF